MLSKTSNGVTKNSANASFNNHPTINFSGTGILENAVVDSFQNRTSFTKIMSVSVTNNNLSLKNKIHTDGVFGSLSIQDDDLKYDIHTTDGTYRNKTNHYDGDGYSVPKIISVRVDGDNSTFTLRSDGVDLVPDETNGNLKFDENGVGLGFGSTANEAGNSFEVGELYIYDRPLTNSEIASIEEKLMIRYRIIPTCELPADTTGYNVSSCDSSGGLIKNNACSVTCATGYTGVALSACEKNSTDFSFSGCSVIENHGGASLSSCQDILTSNQPAGYYLVDADGAGGNDPVVEYCQLNISSCEEAFQSGEYNVDLVGNDGVIVNAVKVFCDVDDVTNEKMIDVVKTLALDGVDINIYKDYFFKSNNTGTLSVSSVENSSSILGIMIVNESENLNDSYSNGFHIHQDQVKFTSIDLNYRMKGSSNSDICSSDSWASLNGPGYSGGYSDNYMSSCPVGKNCIQGTPTLNQDSSINATYSNSNLVTDDVLTFSGFGLTTDYGFSVFACMEDSEIPGNNPGTFITEFKIGNSQWIECNRPTAPSGYTLNCPGDDATLFADQCSVACDTGYISVGEGPQLTCPVAGGDFSFSGCVQAQRISDCSKALASGNYVTTLVSATGEATENVLVYCTVDSGIGYVDVVKTINLPGIDVSQYKDYFFSSNDTSTISIEAATNSSDVKGILVKNSGNNGSTIYNGFHIHQDSVRFTDVNIEYRMQGALITNSCDTGDWVPLSKPWFNRGR